MSYVVAISSTVSGGERTGLKFAPETLETEHKIIQYFPTQSGFYFIASRVYFIFYRTLFIPTFFSLMPTIIISCSDDNALPEPRLR